MLSTKSVISFQSVSNNNSFEIYCKFLMIISQKYVLLAFVLKWLVNIKFYVLQDKLML